MYTIQSTVDTNSESFKANEAQYASILSAFNERLAAIYQSGGEAAVAKHKSRNKLLARERIELLIDPHTPLSSNYPHLQPTINTTISSLRQE